MLLFKLLDVLSVHTKHFCEYSMKSNKSTLPHSKVFVHRYDFDDNKMDSKKMND